MLNKTLQVFPTGRAIREYISSLKTTNQLLPKSITIGDFLSKVIYVKNKTYIDKDLRILYLKEAIKDIDIEKLGLNSNFSKFYTQSEYILKFFNELNNEYKTIEDIEINDTYALYVEHLDILKVIYNRYIEILDKHNLIDNITLPLYYDINQDFIKEFNTITIFYEGYFSTFEFDIILKIAQITNLNIHLTINQFNHKNIEMFKRCDISLQPQYHYNIDITNHKIIWENKLQKIALNHTIYPISQRITQVAFVKYAITKMVKDGIDPNKIIVLLPDEDFSIYLKLFDTEKYFNFAMGNDINNSITIKRAKAIESYITNCEPKDIKKIEFFNLDTKYIHNNIKPYWNSTIQKDIFFNMISFIIEDEPNEQILSKLIEIKLGLENLLFKQNSTNITLKDGYKIFISKLQEISLDDVYGGVVTVLGILETRYIQYDGVIVVDFNDDKIPKRSIKDKFLSTKVKEISNLPTLKDREDLQRYYYQELFSKAKQISISYLNDEQNTISRFAKQIFTKQNIQYKDFSKILQNSDILKYTEQNISLDINLANQEWSATSLKTYLQCKRRYYLHYIQNIKEHNFSLKPKGYELGQIIHNTLEKLYKTNSFSYENLKKELTKYQGVNPYLTLDIEIWKDKLLKFVNNDIKRLQSGISIYQLEKPFKLKYNNITIKGAIDRIDKLPDGSYTILDYKTSSTLKIDTNKNYEKSCDFQLEFYFLALRDININEVGYYDLNDGSIKKEIMLQEKISRLDEIFKELNSKNVNFAKCENIQECIYCPYKTICDRE